MRRILYSDDALDVGVTRYAPGERQDAHRDVAPRISFTLRGAGREEAASGSAVLTPGDMLYKSHTARHENAYSERGQVIASIAFAPRDGEGDGGLVPTAFDDVWAPRRGAAYVRLWAAALEAAARGDGAAVRVAAIDLVARLSDDADGCAAPPAWLARLKDELETCGLGGVDVAARARAAGAHPAHASRLFRRCFGASITEHAQLHRVRAALIALAETTDSLSDVALGAGFYDQAHMCRVFRRVTGTSPGAYRRLDAAVAG